MDDQKLWDLLGRSPRPDAPAFFAGKVMRQIEAAGPRPGEPLRRRVAAAVREALLRRGTAAGFVHAGERPGAILGGEEPGCRGIGRIRATLGSM